MPDRIYLHPGFHKTGTSSIQHFLWVNRQRLAPRVDLRMLRHLQEPVKLCAAYSRSGNPLFVVDLVEALDAALAEHPLTPGRDLLISSEGLSGHLPGWPGVDSYAAAPVTIAAVAGWLADRFPGAEIRIVLTLRDRAPWIDSVWRHHLLGHRLKMDRATFARTYGASADLAALAARVGETLAPTDVRTLRLEAARDHPLGPGGALLEAFGLAPVEGMEAVGPGNRGPDAALAARLLDLNRSDLAPTALRSEKARLAREAGLSGWATRDAIAR